MTALKQYQRLESSGLWRETPAAQRRDVIVSFGDASLVLSDSRSDTPLTHWSLPAVIRLNPGETPALYAPGEAASETLELDDATMIEAIETVHRAVEGRRPRPGRLRYGLLGAGLAAVIAVGAWMPGALIRHTAQVVPFSKRQEIGRMVLADMGRVTGTPCADPQGQMALGRLTARLFGRARVRIAVLRDAPVATAHLPGGLLLLRHDLVENYDGPEIAAGYLLAERARAEAADPLVALLKWAGLRATFRLLTTGSFPAKALHGYGAVLLARAEHPAPLPEASLLARFRAAGVDSAAYARALGPDPAAAGLIANDPFAGKTPPPLIPDDSWVSLQGICTD
ncbi:hypothetical protein [Acidimangrovimonas pyrenivorans]|uniref:Peptidase M48 Ste24p n=1 Tax=Acidimangrovimonas pyrenivorans TaxID=2030798 RepID=A0ABV7AN00_9RHOB